jgi:hypothetical protein
MLSSFLSLGVLVVGIQSRGGGDSRDKASSVTAMTSLILVLLLYPPYFIIASTKQTTDITQCAMGPMTSHRIVSIPRPHNYWQSRWTTIGDLLFSSCPALSYHALQPPPATAALELVILARNAKMLGIGRGRAASAREMPHGAPTDKTSIRGVVCPFIACHSTTS